MEGNPIANKYVIAFTWPEPHFSGEAIANNIEAHKMAWLEGDVSEPSDADGIAIFTDLKIMGSNSKFVYMFFTCDAVTTQSWSKSKPETYDIYSLPYYVAPIKLVTAVDSVAITK